MTIDYLIDWAIVNSWRVNWLSFKKVVHEAEADDSERELLYKFRYTVADFFAKNESKYRSLKAAVAEALGATTVIRSTLIDYITGILLCDPS